MSLPPARDAEDQSRGASEASLSAASPADDGEPTLEGAFSADGVDLTLIEWMLDLTPEERLQAAQSMVDLVAAARPLDAD